jgi:hypothetical protein
VVIGVEGDVAVNQTEVAEIRKRVENQYGKELASEASGVFCLALGHQTPQSFAAFEEGVAEGPPVSAIDVECVPRQERIDRVRNAAEELKKAPAWGRLRDSLEEVRTPEIKL